MNKKIKKEFEQEKRKKKIKELKPILKGNNFYKIPSYKVNSIITMI